METKILTDVQSCYVVTCANNNALACDLMRISLDSAGKCLACTPEETEEEVTATSPVTA